ncbi:MAG: dienelactone hydrolase family protein [Acidobacteriota bacterium]
MVSVQAADGGAFDAYLALPGSSRGPGIVLMHEIFGVNGFMREVADWYAARGFAVLCPDLFWRQARGVELSDRSEADRQEALRLYEGLDEAQAVRDVGSAMEFLRRHPACTGGVGGVGFCLGGKLAYLLAARHAVDCCVGYYGVGIEKALDEAAAVRSPLMLHLAGRDRFCPPPARARIRRALGPIAGITLHDYPGRDHAFARTGGEHHDAGAAELANLRTLEFLLCHLGWRASDAPPAGPDLARLWEEHVRYEFDTRDTESTLGTMVEDAYVNHVPVLTGGVGREDLREFYSRRFIPKMPPDTTMTPVSRTVGADTLVDEMIFRFTHSIEMDWMLPGIAPTGRRVEVPLVAIVHFRDGRLAHEHIYWDQASVLIQIGLLDARRLPAAGIESARKIVDPSAEPSNRRSERAGRGGR